MSSGPLLRGTPSGMEQLIGIELGITVSPPDKDDTVTIAVCASLFGLTGIMLVYAWCNYSYRPIRAKNLVWTTLIYVSTVLWFVGNLATNGHVRNVGAWGNCKLWVIWFRILFCFVFASMTVVRFYALDRVFNQRKPFTTWSGLVAGAIVIVLNVAYCLVNQLISDNLTVKFEPLLQICNVTMAVRISALATQWVLWAGVSLLIFRLRNIQSGFNELFESIGIFVVIVALLIESTVVYVHFKYYVLQKRMRIQKTVMDAAVANLVVWLFVGHAVLMCMFRRHSYEQRWLDRLARDGPASSYVLKQEPGNRESYSKMNDNTFGSTDMINSTLRISGEPRHDSSPWPAPSSGVRYDDSLLPVAMRRQIHIHEPALSSPTTLRAGLAEPVAGGRHVL
ncbi:hypothetical protein H4R18_004269 [Coemansia javaensis]|uniref:Uncharacterized protein n=1 Tax=Coemansia javaensis TaxID=2761396 RepID=A0A9W8LG14_9FUNG|nr:hypothetical protein H4R18_004269 [Coemansia javaensis]